MDKQIRELSNEEIIISLQFALVKIYQLKYFDFYYMEKNYGVSLKEKDKTKKLIDRYPLMLELIKKFEI